MLVALIRADCGVWQLECQASKVTASVHSDPLLYVDTRFQSFSPLINRIVHHALLKFSSCLNKPLPQLVRIADWYSVSHWQTVKYIREVIAKNISIILFVFSIANDIAIF